MKNYTYRHAEELDLSEIQTLINLCDVDDFGTDEFAIDVKETWENIPYSNTYVVINHLAKIVGYGFIEEMGKGRLDSYGFVLPSEKGQGIGSLLIHLLEQCAKALIDDYEKQNIEYEFNNVVPFSSFPAKNLVKSRGYSFKRIYSIMSIQLEDAPTPPSVPEGITIQICTTPEQEREIYEVYCEAFADSNSFYPRPFEQWLKDKKGNGFDQSLWYIASVNNEIASFIIGEKQDNKIWVNLLGTKRNARRQGLGTLLLKKLFMEAYEKGYRRVSLSVDDYSSTNANHVYQNVGMSPVFQIGMYEKKL
jgi:mycothiol synthase